MAIEIFDEEKMREMSDEDRFQACEQILKNDDDESKRWDAVWLIGELAENKTEEDPMFNKVADVIEWVMRHDNNGVVKHEASFQIAARNIRSKIPLLIDAALHSESVLTKHESIESLGLMRAFEAENMMKEALNDPSIDVRETAKFVLKRFSRMKNQGEYNPSVIL